MLAETLAQLVAGRPLTEAEAHKAFAHILEGEADDAQIGALLAFIARRGPTIDELVGAARAMRDVLTPIPYTPPEGEALIDTCGTGGAPKTFNISTAAALVVAGAKGSRRVRVAKHGNRSRTGRGSAEVLAALGVNVNAPPEAQARCLERAGLCFCFAIHHHPATRHASSARKSLAFPTIFNLLGPLTNPALAPRQLIGVYDRIYVEPMARALHRLGAERAMVVHGLDKMDEISTADRTYIAHLKDGAVSTELFDCASIPIKRARQDDLRADTIDAAAAIIRSILEGQPGPPRDIVTLNAGAALFVADAASTIREGVDLARKSIDSGAAGEALRALASASAS